ncbi:prepilin peptidase [Falsiroseomonas sp.]|jgi:prepilin peptidase CpaA|uniref:prepilin peptidase n=1 Tax=Falsiroseomonas sp. TaxID=2870721 RepID=UPI003F6FC9E0
MSMMDVVAPLAALALIAAALHDVVARTIPNAIPAFVALLGLALRAAEGDLAWGLLAFVLVFALAVIAWRYHVMGGGDVKLLAACALLPAPGSVADMMVAIALAGGALSLFYLAFRGRRPLPIPPRAASLPARAWRAEIWRLRRGGPLPYGVAICGGVLLTLAG